MAAGWVGNGGTVHTHVREKVSDRIKKKEKNTREREPWMCQGRQERERMDRSLVNVVGRYNTTVYRVPNSAITGVYSAQTRRRRTLTVTRCVNV